MQKKNRQREQKSTWIDNHLHKRAAVVAIRKRRSIEAEINTCVEIGLKQEEAGK